MRKPARPGRARQRGTGAFKPLAAFLREPFLGGLQRPFTFPTVAASLLGMILHLIASGPPAPGSNERT